MVVSSRSVALSAAAVGQAEHQHLGAGGLTLSTISRAGRSATEIGDAQAAAGGEHRRAQRRDLVALAGRGRKQQAGRRLAARVQPEERAEEVPHRRRHQVLVRDARPPAVPVVADLREHRHQHVLEQFERTQDRGQPARSPGRWPTASYFAQRGDERGRIERCPPRRSGRGRRARAGAAAELAQFSVAEPGEPADAVSLLDGAAEQPQARDVGFRVHPAAIVADRRDGAVAALPGAQRVDADPGQPGDRADRVARRRRRVVSLIGPRSGRPPRTRPTPAPPTPRRPASARTATAAASSSW